jgi:hypothetical protein
MVAFAASLLATIVLEVSVLLFLVTIFKNEKPLSSGRILAAGILASSATLPYVWFVIPETVPNLNSIYLGEILAIIAEGEIYVLTLGLSRPRALTYSFVCNAISYSASPIVAFVLAKTGVSPY